MNKNTEKIEDKEQLISGFKVVLKKERMDGWNRA